MNNVISLLVLLFSLLTSQSCLAKNIFQTLWDGFGSLVALPTIAPLPAALKEKSPVVNITNGEIQGIVATSRDGREYFEYLGIPYASPPIGNLRFMVRKTARTIYGKWSEVKEHFATGPSCPQSNPLAGGVEGDESCLVLNVYQPKLEDSNQSGGLPVMVWFHGGSFTGGNANLYRGKYIMDTDVVLVVVQYRLGALGFLSTGDTVIGGNMGFRDQILSLKWVQKNIRSFNGNPNLVTIFGESAGGASVHFLTISPMAKGLFHKAIAMSGTATAWWALSKDPKKHTKHFAQKFGCTRNRSSEVLSCLQEVDYKLLVQRHDGVDYTSAPPRFDAFAATVDSWYEGEDAFLPKPPLQMVEEGNVNKVSFILGVTRGDGGLITSSVESSTKLQQEIRDHWHEYSCLINGYPCTNETQEASEQIRDNFFAETPSRDPSLNLGNLTQMISETVFWYPAYKAALAHSQVAPTRLYFYNYTSSISLYPLYRGASGTNPIPQSIDIGLSLLEGIFNKLLFVLEILKIRFSSEEYRNWGPTHGDDVIMLFDPFGIELVSSSSKDYEFSKMFVQGLTDFASNNKSHLQFGDVDWPVIKGARKSRILVLELPPKVTKNVLYKSSKFWDKIYHDTKIIE